MGSQERLNDVAENRSLDAGALRALAHPLRVQLFDILSQYGPQTASSLAAMTGESSGATSYHLRALARHLLIREVEGRGTARERWWERVPGSVSFTDPEVMKTPSGRAATQMVMAEFLTRRHQQLMRFVTESVTAFEGEGEKDALISTATAHLTRAQAAEMTERFTALVEEMVQLGRSQEEAPGVRAYTIRVDAFALPEDGEDR